MKQILLKDNTTERVILINNDSDCYLISMYLKETQVTTYIELVIQEAQTVTEIPYSKRTFSVSNSFTDIQNILVTDLDAIKLLV